MWHHLLALNVIDGPYLACSIVVASGSAVVAVARAPKRRRTALIGGVVASVVVGVVLWLLRADGAFGGIIAGRAIPVAATATGFATCGIVVAIEGPRGRRALGVVCALSAVLAGALGVNSVYGVTPTLASLIGVQALDRVGLPARLSDAALTPVSDWVPPKDMASHGRLGALSDDLRIPSGTFSPRDAGIYLPPAALGMSPPALPFMVFMMGQPGTPDPELVGHVMDEFADAHQGLAPIVLVVDQIGTLVDDPACVDSARYGAVETYINELVPRWALQHLNITQDHRWWTVAGYSNGGACAALYGARHPDTWGAFGDVSGTRYPGADHPHQVRAQVYGGDPDAGRADWPENVMAATSRDMYSGHVAVITWGISDDTFGPGSQILVAAARRAGFEVVAYPIEGTGHFGSAFGEGTSEVLRATSSWLNRLPNSP